MRHETLYVDNGSGAIRNPALSEEEFNTLLEQQRKADIYTQLATIDQKRTRPLAEIVGGTATQADHDILAALNTEAATLRGQL